MTGGQMAPTTLIGQKTTTTKRGRDQKTDGYPIKISEMLSTLDGTSFICRTSLDSTKNIITTKNAIKKAFQYQLDGKGFSLVEVLSPCPTDWGLTPVDALTWIREKMIPVFPLGVIKDKYNEG
jgi:2-oxoglutarate ferredoxin oxidoreductase subunit beta